MVIHTADLTNLRTNQGDISLIEIKLWDLIMTTPVDLSLFQTKKVILEKDCSQPSGKDEKLCRTSNHMLLIKETGFFFAPYNLQYILSYPY